MIDTLNRRNVLILMAGAVSLPTLPAFAKQAETFTRDGLAIGGYDTVAYHTMQKPLRGNAAFTSDYNGAVWQFASTEHKALFDGNPEKYAPAYGGYCAYAVARNYTAKTEPDAWTIYKDTLFLNYSKAVRVLWSTNKAGNVKSADANWPSVLAN